MNKRAREFIVKLFSLILAITMSIPTNVFASAGTKRPKEMPTVIRLADSGGGEDTYEDTYIEDTTEDTYIEDGEKVYSEYIEETNPADPAEVIEEAPQEQAHTIAEEDSRNYILSQKARLNDNHDGIIYDIKVAKKEKSYHDLNNKLSLSLMLNPNQDLKDIKLSKVVIDGKEEKRDDKSNKQGDIQSLNLATPSFENEITYTVEASIDKKAIDTNKLYSMDLSLDIGQFNLILQRISYKFVEYEKEDKTKELKLTHIKEAEDALRSISYKKDDGEVDTVIYTDYIISKDKGDEESRVNNKNKINYGINLENLKKEDTEISLDYYKADNKGFNIKKEFSAKVPYQEKLDLDIPASYILKLTVTSKTDKKNTKIESHKINGREVKSPRFVKEEENSSDDDEEAAKKAKEEKKAAEEKAKAEERRKAEEAKKAEAEKQAEEAKKAEEEAKSAAEKKEAEEKAKSEQEAKEAKEKEARDKIQAEKEAKEKEDLLKALKEKSPTKDEENKAKTEVKEDSNLSKADAELKAVLADKTKGIEDIQNILTRLGEKYKLTREDQAKLMTANDSAIKTLVEKDRKENFRPNVLATVPSDSFEDKKFKLKTTMQVKAKPGWPIPSGWYFDINLGPYLKEIDGKPLNNLYHNGQLIATAQIKIVGNDKVIRYTYVRKVTESIDLNIDQDLEFDADAIGDQNPITLDIKVAPKNNPVQSHEPITVYKDTPSPVTSENKVIDQGETQSGTYPYQLDWRTTSQFLKDKQGNKIEKLADLSPSKLQGAYVERDIEVDTKSLLDKEDNKLVFDNLNLTVFGSAKQGLKNISYSYANSEGNLKTAPENSSSNLGEIYSGNSSIKKEELGEKLYIKVRGEIDPDQVHETYSIGFRLNPDKNYIDNLIKEYQKKLDKIPSPIKWLKGVEGARRFAEVPFNLVETNIPATFNGLHDRFTNERFYYDNTRTIVANRKSDTRADWYALDLIRRGETQDPALDDPTFDINNGQRNQDKNIRPRKVYFVPLKEGGYRKTYQAGDVVLQNGKYYPGTLVSYEYQDEKGNRNDTYNFRANLREKKKFNIDEAYDTEGGEINLFTEKVSNQALINGYLAYTEDPYPVMRINRNFDLVACFNDQVKAPVYTGNNGIFLDKHEDVSGDYLITRLNETIRSTSSGYKLKPFLNGTPYQGVYLNHGGLSEGQAMEELMKKIYFYGEEVKKEYSKNNNGEEMHRLIESSMYQRVIHHFTDGKSLEQDYFGVPSSYNVDEWKVDHTLQGIRQAYPKTGWDGSFVGTDKSRKTDQGLRKLKDKETRIKNYPPVQSTQYDMAQKLYNKVMASYSNNDWNKDKADSVKLVFYSHTDEGKYQELITGRVMAPIEIDKYKKDGTKLKGAKFKFINIDSGESKEWTSTEGDTVNKLYLRPGKYKVQEMETPQGFEKIEDFDIEVKRTEVNPDDGPYKAKKLPKIHVNDGFKTELVLGDNIPKTADNKPLVEIDKDNNIKVKVTNIEDNLGKLEFVKRNKFIKLDGAEFRLRKINAKDLNDAKTKFQNPSTLTYDSKYDKTEKGSGGDFKFDQIPAGFYVLEETKVPAGYEKAPLYLLEAKEITDANKKKKVQVSFVQEYKEVTNEKSEKEAKITDANLEPEKASRDGNTVDLPIIRNKTKKTQIKFRKVRTENLGTDKEHLGLGDAKFRLMSIGLVDGDFYLKEAFTDHSTPTKEGEARVDGQQARGGGYITFDGLKAGEYLLEELQAPKGYNKTDLYGWKLVVKELKELTEDDKKAGKKIGDLDYKLYEIPKGKNINDTNLKEVKLDEIINDKDKIKAFQIGNTARTIDVPFKKYKGTIVEKPDGSTEVEATEDTSQLKGKNGRPVSFNLYKSDFYGAIIGEKDKDGNYIPLNKEPIIQDEEGIFQLKGLEFGGYYILRETNPPAGYKKADDITLKVEAEAIADEGKMKVIIRDPNTNAKTDLHSVFKGVVDFEEGAKLGKFSIKKVGNAIGAKDENGNPVRVGLRRAYFRLYTANDKYEIEYKDPETKKYPKEYIQKVTPGVPITKPDGKGGQIGKTPEEIEKEAPNQGIVTFDQLKPGKYVLEEFRGPAGYERDPNNWYIRVEKDGTVKKYRDNPANTTKPRTAEYLTQSVRYQSFGLDDLEPIQLNELIPTALGDNLSALEYNTSTEDLDINVKAGEVDTSNGKRTINVSIKPKEKAQASKKIQMVFLVERSSDSSLTSAGSKISDGRTQDKNINYAITQIAKKAKETGASVDVSFIEYTYNASNLKTTNTSLDEMTQGLGDNDYSTFYVDGKGTKAVTYKDYISKANISDRNKSVVDGSEYLNKNIDTYLNQISAKDRYDKKIMVDFANFSVKDVKKHSPKSGKYQFYKADIVNKFKNNGFDTFVAHTDQRSVNLASGFQSQYAYETMPTLQFFEYFNNSGSPGRNSASHYVYSNMINKLFENEAFKTDEESYLVKDASLNLTLRNQINLLESSANIGSTKLNTSESKSGTNDTIKIDNINLKKGESLDLSYTIDLKTSAEYDTTYPINSSIKFINNGNESLISSIDPSANEEISTKKIKKEDPTPDKTYSINLIQSQGGKLELKPQGPYTAGTDVTVTITPDSGKKLDKLKIGTNEIPVEGNTYTFPMPAQNIDVSATFIDDGSVTPQPKGDMTIRANFIYTNQKDGIDDSKNIPNGHPGEIKLQVKQGLNNDWVDVDKTNQPAPYNGTIDFKDLDASKDYKLVYTRDTEIAGGWGSETITEIPIDWTKADKDNIVRVDITNGNLIQIFNHDETGFRIPLRISKVNENKAALTGSQFKARKIINGEKAKIYEKNKDGSYTYTGKTGYPKYHAEKFDGVSEATGKPGDNYFRELTPGIYELTEIKTPNDSYRLPKDKDGKPMKWYFKVVVNDKKVPRDANYMDITFDFEHTFKKTDDFNEIITDKEKKELIGKTIKGFTRGDPDFARYIEEIKDDGRSDPARPDAPYKWIHDARVTNYRNKTSLSFMKKDKDTHRNIAGAEFSLRKAKLDEKGNLVFENNKPAYEPEKTTDSEGKALTEAQLDLMRVQPYDKDKKFAKATSSEKLGVEFTNIEAGTYILEEIKPADGYKPTDSFIVITFKEAKDGSWTQVVKGYEKDANGTYKEMPEPNNFISKDDEGKFISVNNDKNFIDLKFQKIEGKKVKVKEGGKIVEKEVPVESADFKITQVDKDGKKLEGGYEKTIYSYANSNFEFKNLGVGRYKLQETRAINKFEKPDPWFFNVVQDPKTYKLKIEFEKNFDGNLDESIGFKTKANGDPDYDDDGNLQDIKIRNYSKTNFSFQKLSSELDEHGNKKPLKDAYFRLTKVRFSMDEKAKSYEYYGEDKNAVLKKYNNGKRITEYTDAGGVSKFTLNGKVYEFDNDGNLTKVNGDEPSQTDKDDIKNKKVQPDAISNATGKYSSLRRSQSTGRVDFQNLGEGIYQLEEVGIPEGYQSDTKQFKWIFKVEKTDDGLQVTRKFTDSEGKEQDIEEEYFKKYDKDYYQKVYLKNKFKENSNIEEGDKNSFSYKITNTKTTTDLKWKKIGSKENTTPIKKDTKFVMLKTTDNPADIDSKDENKVKAAISGQSEYPPYQIESTDGTFIVTDLAKGVYNLIESKAPDGYEKMNRKIAIKIYEDKEGLKKQFYEITEDGKLVKNIGSFEAILNNSAIVTTDKDGYFHIINKQKPYFFYLSKGFMKNVNGKEEFTDITKGKLKVKIYADPEVDPNPNIGKNTDTKVYEQTIDLSDDKSYRINVDGVELGKNYILEEVGAPDGFTVSKNKYRLQFAEDNDKKLLIKLMAVIGPDNKVLKGTKNTKYNRTETGDEFNPNEGYVIQGPSTTANNGPLKIVNKKTEVVFTKFGEDENAEGGKKPLEGVRFYLEKQDPDDIQKENQGYYPLTKNMEMIKPKIGDDGRKTYYYISKETGKEVAVNNFNPEKITDPPVGIYKSDSDGKFKITDLTDGYYRVIEPEAPEYEKGKKYMKVNGPIKTFRVVNGKVYIYTKIKEEDGSEKVVEKEIDETNKDELGKIINQKPGKGEFELTKVDEKGNGLEDVEFTLHKTDADETKVGEKTTGPDGKIKFTGLPYGYYWLKESETKDGYILDTKKKLIALGGDKEWKVPEKPKDDVSKSITFDGKQEELVSTEDSKRADVVYPNKAEGIFAKYKFKIDEKADIKPGDYFTIKFSDNVDLDGINKDNDDKGQKGDEYFNIIGPAGLLAKAKVNDDRRSITYTFTDYVKDYKPESMSMYLQLFPNRRKINRNMDITVTADIGNNQTNESKYHYSDGIKIDYRGYQNEDVDISSYVLRLDPDGKTFTAIIYYNPWNRTLTNKNIYFTTDHDIIQNSLSVKTYWKFGTGTNEDYWRQDNLPDSYDVNFTDGTIYKLVGERYLYERIFDNYNRDTGNTRNVIIPREYLNQDGYNKKSYVIEIKGKLAGDSVESLKTWANYYDHVVYTPRGTWYTHTGKFETWSQFFNPGASGDVNKEIKLVNHKNKIEYAKVDGGVVSNVIDTASKNPQKLKDLGIGDPLKGAEFKLVKDGTDVAESKRTSDENGIFSWEGLAPGSYQVIETKTPDDKIYDLPKNGLISSFTVDDNGNIVNIIKNKQILENYRKAQIKIRKTDREGNNLDGAEFLLTATGKQKYTANIGTKQADNTILFDKLPAGTYTLEERKAPQGYIKSDNKWDIEVTRDGKVRWTNSFTPLGDKMKAVSDVTYSGDSDKDNLKSEIIGINPEAKTFRQKITINAKPSELEQSKFVLDATSPDLKLSQSNTIVRLVRVGDKNTIKEKDDSTYTVEINNGESPNLTLRINPPYRNKKANKAVGSSEGSSPDDKQTDDDKERVYQFIVDMPYKDDSRIGAKVSYNSVSIDKYVDKSNLTISNDIVNMKAYNNNYLDRDINLLTTDIGNIKQPDIYLKKVDADDNTTGLAGAEFELQKRVGNDYNSIDKKGNIIANPADNTEKWTASSDGQGNFEFNSIPDDEYRIVETKAPTGYVLSDKTVYKFIVKNGKVYKVDMVSDKIDDKELLVGEKKNSTDNRIEITNKKAQYPYTGGPGVWIGFTILGVLTMTAAGIYLAQKKKYQTK